MPEPIPLSIQTFFDELVPRLLMAQPKKRLGVCRIRILGAQAKSWNIDLALGVVGSRLKPDVTLEMLEEDFRALLVDQLDWPEAVCAGRIRAEGRLQVLADFAAALETQS